MILHLAKASLGSRRLSAAVSFLVVAVSVMLFLLVGKAGRATHAGFVNSLSGTDLIVGARGSPLNLLLYSVFRMGTPIQNMSWDAYRKWASHPAVAWTIPISLGDSHRGFRVVGTDSHYFRNFRHGQEKELEIAEGSVFSPAAESGEAMEVVLGRAVAQELGYRLGDELVLTHGISDVASQRHGNYSFKTVGILEATGTPIDRSVHTTLAGIEIIHRPPSNRQDLTPRAITAAFFGLHSRLSIFQLQRAIETDTEEPLTAALPGVALQQLWKNISMVEKALAFTSLCVVLVAFAAALGMLWTQCQYRKREMAILRALGVRRGQIYQLVLTEAGVMSGAGILAGYVLAHVAIAWGARWALTEFNLHLYGSGTTLYEFVFMAMLWAGALIVSLLPAHSVYRHAVQEGLSPRY